MVRNIEYWLNFRNKIHHRLCFRFWTWSSPTIVWITNIWAWSITRIPALRIISVNIHTMIIPSVLSPHRIFIPHLVVSIKIEHGNNPDLSVIHPFSHFCFLVIIRCEVINNVCRDFGSHHFASMVHAIVKNRWFLFIRFSIIRNLYGVDFTTFKSLADNF